MNWQNFKNVITGHTKFDRKLRKYLYGVEEFQKLPLRGRIVKTAIFCSFQVVYTLMVVSVIWMLLTGTLPFGPRGESIVPPEMNPTVTEEQAEQAVENSTLDLAPYGERNNCVELAFIAARQLWWEGLQGTVVRIDFSDGSGHMIVGVPTTDAGWKFLDPQGNMWINPRVGGFFMDKQITGLYYLYDFIWEPIEEVQE